MKIILLTQYYFPETGATSNRLHSMARFLSDAGHDVTVIAEKPNHPAGIFHPGYERGWFLRREYDGIRVLYTWVRTKPEKQFLDRILFYVSFMITSVVGSLLLPAKFDVVLASSPPLFVGPAGWIVAKLKRARYVFDVRDLWPQVAVAMGELTAQRAIGIAEKVERFCYRKADAITTVTESFRREIGGKAPENVRTHLVMNGALVESLDRVDRKRSRATLHSNNTFLVTYAGNIGLAQGLEHVIHAARILQDSDPDVVFRIVGDGPKRTELRRLAAEYGLTNLEMIDRLPLDRALEHIVASDALLVPLADHPIYRMFIPSKLFDSMAAGRPVLLSVAGEARTILESVKAGLYYDAEDGCALARAVQALKNDPVAAGEMGRRGYDAAHSLYSREKQWKVLEELMLSIVQRGSVEGTCKHR